MPNERAQNGQPNPLVALTPQANPVDTYSTPIVEKPAEVNPLMSLARGLQHLAPALVDYLDYTGQKQDKLEYAQGSQERLDLEAKRAQNRDVFKMYVDKGDLRPAQSPWFIKGWKEQHQKLAGMDYGQQLTDAWAKSDVKNSNNPADFNAFTQSFTSQFIKDRNLEADPVEFQSSFMPIMDAKQNQVASMQAQHRMAAIEQEVDDNTTRLFGSQIDSAMQAPGGLQTPENVQAAAAAITAIGQDAFSKGLSGTKINDLVVKSIQSKMLENAQHGFVDPDLLKVADQIDFGKGPVGSVARVRDALLQAEQQARKDVYYNNKDLEAQAAFAKRQASDKAMSDLLVGTMSDPSFDSKPGLQALAANDPEGYGKAQSLIHEYKASLAEPIVENPYELGTLQSAVQDGTATERDVIAMATARKLSQPHMLEMLGKIQEVKKHGAITQDPVAAELGKDIIADLSSDGLGKFDNSEQHDKARAAQRIFFDACLSYNAKNPDADPNVRMKFFMDARDHAIALMRGGQDRIKKEREAALRLQEQQQPKLQTPAPRVNAQENQ